MLHSSDTNSPTGVPQQNVLDLRKMAQAKRTPPAAPPKKPVQRKLKEQWEAIRPVTLHIQKPKLRKTMPRPSFAFVYKMPVHWRSVLVFAAVAILLLSPLMLIGSVRKLHATRGEVLAASSQAYAFLRQAGDEASQFQFGKAEGAFAQALAAFEEAEESFQDVGGALTGILRVLPFTGGSVTSGEALLTAGQSVARAGQRFTQAAETLTTSTEGVDAITHQGANLEDVFTVLPPALDEVSGDIAQALTAIERVDVRDVPEAYRDAVEQIQEQLPILSAAFQRIHSTVQVLATLFSSDDERQFALVFQNSNELRATGGFMGSWALVSIHNGEVKVLEVPGRGFLDLNFGTDLPYVPPEPLQLINPTWQVQDANWWPDFPTSAEKINRFYERARGYELDGVIAITPALVEDMLALTGEISLPDFDVTVDADSFRTSLQDAVELQYDIELNQPKQVIGKLMPELLSRLFALPPGELLQSAGILTEALARRDIQIYSRQAELQEQIVSLGWAGNILHSPHDYLQVVETNIGGGKTDRSIQQEISHEVSVQSDGRLEVHLTLHRAHLGEAGDRWTGIKNVSFIRFYVPQGSQFLAANGFTGIGSDRFQQIPEGASLDPQLDLIEKNISQDEISRTQISEGFGKTIFGNWLELDPGEEAEVSIHYVLPFTWQDVLESGYSLYVQQQAGAGQRELQSRLSFPKGYSAVWSSPSGGEVFRLGESIHFDAKLALDQSYAVLFEKDE